MARPIWKGHISFGLVSVPVSLVSAERRSDLSFHLIDSRNQARCADERVNEITGEETPWDQIVKGYEYDDNNYVLLTDEDFKRAAPEATQTVDIEEFVDREAVSLLYFDKPYYLVPGKKGEKGYALLREALRKTKKIGIARVVVRTREHLAALLVEGDVLVLNLMRFHQEVRDASELDVPGDDLKALKVSPKEVEMAVKLVENMSGKWKPEQFHDTYRDALMKWIEQKATTGKATTVYRPTDDEDERDIGPINFMELLQKSVAGAGKGGRATGGSTATAARKKKAPARKTPIKRKRKAG